MYGARCANVILKWCQIMMMASNCIPCSVRLSVMYCAVSQWSVIEVKVCSLLCLPWSGTAHSSSHQTFAQEGQLARGRESGMSELRWMRETSSFLSKGWSLSYQRGKKAQEYNIMKEGISLPRSPWPKSNLEIPSSTKEGLGAIFWNRGRVNQSKYSGPS